MTTRINQQPENAEKIAAYQIEELAEWLQEILYVCADEDHTFSPETTKELNRTYRTLKRFSVWFYGAGERPLSWDPPDTRFHRKDSK
jgi:hypothetical protein